MDGEAAFEQSFDRCPCQKFQRDSGATRAWSERAGNLPLFSSHIARQQGSTRSKQADQYVYRKVLQSRALLRTRTEYHWEAARGVALHELLRRPQASSVESVGVSIVLEELFEISNDVISVGIPGLGYRLLRGGSRGGGGGMAARGASTLPALADCWLEGDGLVDSERIGGILLRLLDVTQSLTAYAARQVLRNVIRDADVRRVLVGLAALALALATSGRLRFEVLVGNPSPELGCSRVRGKCIELGCGDGHAVQSATGSAGEIKQIATSANHASVQLLDLKCLIAWLAVLLAVVCYRSEICCVVGHATVGHFLGYMKALRSGSARNARRLSESGGSGPYSGRGCMNQRCGAKAVQARSETQM